MTIPLGAGALTVTVSLYGGTVCAVEIGQSRPRDVSALFLGRPAREVPGLAGQIFSLCGFAQSTAATLALSAAGAMKSPDPVAVTIGLAAEHLFETLRSLALSWPVSGGGMPPLGDLAADLRSALAASRLLTHAAAGPQRSATDLKDAATRLRQAAEALGITADGVREGSLLAAIRAETQADRTLALRPPDCLTAADDIAVVAGLAADPVGFAACPVLPRRTPETGAYARHPGASAGHAGELAARLDARLSDCRATLDRLDRAIAGTPDPALTTSLADPQASAGTGIVECARGRLYHRFAVNAAGSVTSAALLAPTEWNFQPGGPFAGRLIGATLGTGEAARNTILRLAALMDPCVALDLVMRETAHA